jgi:transcriptional regulator with PAS, ATPase and Fis domain
MIGHSPVWLAALERVRQAGATTADILLQAESGTGKSWSRVISTGSAHGAIALLWP